MSLDDNRDLSAASMNVQDVISAVPYDGKPAPVEQTFIVSKDGFPNDVQTKDFDAPIQKSNLLVHVPTPSRRRTATPLAESVAEAPVISCADSATSQSHRLHHGPTPWEMPKASTFSQQEGTTYRDQLRISGQQALQRAREHGLVPKPSMSTAGASSPHSSAAPLPLSIFGALNTQQATTGSQVSGVVQPQQHIQYQMQPAFFQTQAYFQPQQTCFQPQQAFFVAQVSPMMGYQTSGQPHPCYDQTQLANPASSPTGFELNKEQMAEMLKHASEDVYED